MPEGTADSTWRGHGSVRTASGDLSIELVPTLGGKIASIIWRGHELLLQPRDGLDWSRPRVDYETAELCGWDEMFPTIIGAGMPDHGEVWSRHWVPSQDVVGEYGVECTTVPAYFGRSVRVVDGSALRLDYRVINRSTTPLEFLWAAHPQFVVVDDDRVVVHGPPLHLVTEHPGSELVVVRSAVRELAAPGRAGKWWNALDDRVTGVSVERADVRLTLLLEADCDAQWGLWVDRGAIAPRDVVSVQPAFGWHDDLARARQTSTAAVVRPGATLSWSLALQFAPRSG